MSNDLNQHMLSVHMRLNELEDGLGKFMKASASRLNNIAEALIKLSNPSETSSCHNRYRSLHSQAESLAPLSPASETHLPRDEV
jgi:hypothetical protein